MLTRFTGLAKKLPSPIYKFLAQRWIDYDFPRHIFLETTANCNLSCDYCPREKIKEDMEFVLFKQIIDEATNYGPRSFSLHLFGEPLLYPRILEAIRYIKQKNSRHTVLLTTNGTLLNKYARGLRESRVDRIIWSWRKNNFDDYSIHLLREKGIIRLLIEETPKEEFEKWSKFPRVEIKHLHNYGGNIDVSRYGLDAKANRADRWPCYHLWLAPAVRFNGDITICCNDPNGMEVIDNYYRGGSLTKVWNGDTIKAIRQSHLDKQYKGLCKGCNVWNSYPSMF